MITPDQAPPPLGAPVQVIDVPLCVHALQSPLLVANETPAGTVIVRARGPFVLTDVASTRTAVVVPPDRDRLSVIGAGELVGVTVGVGLGVTVGVGLGATAGGWVAGGIAGAVADRAGGVTRGQRGLVAVRVCDVGARRTRAPAPGAVSP